MTYAVKTVENLFHGDIREIQWWKLLIIKSWMEGKCGNVCDTRIDVHIHTQTHT